jgi:hypothetical protein
MANIGSSEWWTETADKLLGMGLDVLKTALTVPKTSTASNTKTKESVTVSNFEGYLPYILGGVAVVGIVIILAKR